MSRKKIGIVGHVIQGKSVDAFGIGVAYMNYFSHFGDVSVINHTETEVRKDLDLIVVPGGPDVDPNRYLKDSDILSMSVGKPCLIRERFDKVLLPKYIEAGIPIFGICRGHQTIAVHFGGTLIQDMKHEYSSSYDRGEKVHGIDYDSRIAQKFGVNIATPKTGWKDDVSYTNTQEVNSIHHQVVGKLPKDAVELARYKVKTTSKGDKIAYNEALYYPNHNIVTVQWHPEECNDELSFFAISYLLSLKSDK